MLPERYRVNWVDLRPPNSEIGLGSWLTFGGGVGGDQAVACIDAAFDAGINFVDTANVYARGAAEEFLGEALASRPRDAYVLATKLFFPMSMTAAACRTAGPQATRRIARAAAHGLRRPLPMPPLRHETPLEETMRALTEVSRPARRAMSALELDAAQIQAALDLVPDGVVKFVSSQPQYSLLFRGPELRCSRFVPRTASARSSGRRSRKAC